MRRFRADLHIHSCLSPCGDLDMSPRGIVRQSLDVELEVIAVCDHNSAENVGAVMRAAAGSGLKVLAGMEVHSREEVHTLAIFDTEEQAMAMQAVVYEHLRGTNRPDIFGDQVVANERDEVEGFNDRLLIGATTLRLEEIVALVHHLGGLSVASHVDRPSYSVTSQLGFVPADLGVDALEYAGEEIWDVPREDGSRFPAVRFSDAHFPAQIGQRFTVFLMESASVEEIRKALRGEGGRSVVTS